ncbi:MAG: type II toxin-antitoxin system HicB family antitoxin [Planctomycetota bacterium]
MDYTVVIEPADDGSFSAYVPDLPGCVSCGDTPGQALDSIREAIQGHLQTLREFGEPVPKPRSFASIVRAA